jgi:D-serine deaminase-like pyridoxal phosphate-dependent protein
MVLKRNALEHNVETVARFAAERGVLLAPHGKTTMAPQLFQRQLAAGAWGITAASAEHARIYRAFGVSRIVLANEVVREDEARWAAAEVASDPDFDFLCYVDSTEGVRVLSEAFAPEARSARVLVELGTPGGRTGCRTTTEARALAEAVRAAPGLALAGVAGFEGILGADRDERSIAAVDAFCHRLGELAADLAASNEAGDFVVSAGGSAYPDRVVDQLLLAAKQRPEIKVVLRSGCYLTHDDGFYDRVSPFASSRKGAAFHLLPALELWATVVSRPESGIAIVGFGKRDAPFDAGLPAPRAVRSRVDGRVRGAEGMTITKLNDQHAFLSLPADDPLVPGDLLSCGISHPCLAFDKWSLLPLVDDAYVVVDAVRTFF